MGAHIKYGRVNMNVLKITTHPEDKTVRVRWRVVTHPGNSIVLAFWQIKLWNVKQSFEEHDEYAFYFVFTNQSIDSVSLSRWVDGFSIFHVGSDGLVYKHVADKVIPDQNEVKVEKSNLAAKLGAALGLISSEEIAESLLATFNQVICSLH